MEGRWSSWRPLALVIVAIAAAAGIAVAVNSGTSKHTAHAARVAWFRYPAHRIASFAHPKWAKGQVPNPLHEAANEGREAHQAKFERDRKEADREGPTSPAAEQVGDRAYPRSYVDDKLAAKGHRGFNALPKKPAGAAAKTRAATDALVTGNWSELGPFTPNVPGRASQFFDPATNTGPSTQESGRVTALAIAPNCAPGDCKLWVAAAGGGIWRTNDALADHPVWIAPPNNMATYAFGSLYYDSANDVLYAGSGEPNGSGDSEAGLGLYKSTDGGASWSLVPGSAAVATNRSIGSIAVDPSNQNTIYIGTDVARHGSSSVNGGRFTPPNAPRLGVYKSTDGGATFSLESDLSDKTPPNPAPPQSGADWFQGGVNKIELDPNNPDAVYAAVQGYGVWRSNDGGSTWGQVFHTMNQNDFSNPNNPVGDTFGDRTEFDLVALNATTTRMYVGDASDDDVTSGSGPLAEAWRNDNIGAVTADPNGNFTNTQAQGWYELSAHSENKTGFGVYGYCQNGQCGYDQFVVHPPGASAGTVWYGGSMNYDELPEYDQFGTGAPPRSNGRAVVRSTNADIGNSTAQARNSQWQDMTAVLADPSKAFDVQSGMHPDLHAIVFADNGQTAFVGSDGGVVRVTVSNTTPNNQSASCAQRTYDYSNDPSAPPTPLNAADLAECQSLLSNVPTAVTPLNDGLRTLQFQSVSVDPANPNGDIMGGTQDNGTWSLQPPSTTGLETVGGDGGQSGFDAGNPQIRYHNFTGGTPDVNFHGNDPDTWLAIYDPLVNSNEAQSFYAPFTADPKVAGRAFVGLEHVWRTDDNGGNEADLVANGCVEPLPDPFRSQLCGDWAPLGANLTSSAFGSDREGQYVVADERAPADTGTMWAATRTGRVFVTSNADASPGAVQFYRIDSSSTPNRFVSGIAIDPNNPNHAWVSYSGYSAYSPGGHVYDVVYDPSTHSATFTDITFNLPDMPVTGVAEDEASGAVFAATDFGVVELAPGTNQWVTAGSGLPGTSVFGLTLSHNGRTLFAATHGRGVYALSLPAGSGGGGGGTGNPAGAIQGPPVLELGTKATFAATGSSPNGPVTFSWQLPGTPSTATGTPVTFTPTKLGVQTIVLTVKDTTGKTAVVTQAVTVRDTKKPTVKISKIKTVKLGKSTTVRGSVKDAGGVKSVKISFGDRKSKTVHLHSNGSFTVRHRYKKAKTYKVKVTATDKSGHKASKSAHAKVRK